MTRTLFSALSAVLLTASAVSGQPPDINDFAAVGGFPVADRTHWGPPAEEDRMPLRDGRFGHQDAVPVEITTGFIFIEGEYVEAPYSLTKVENIILVNNRPLEMIDDSGGSFGRPFGAVRRRFSRLEELLVCGGVIATWNEHSPLELTDDQCELFLKAAEKGPRERQEDLSEFLASLSPEADRQFWLNWLHRARFPRQFTDRAGERLQELEESRQVTERVLSGERHLDRYGYSLSMAGMIIVVLAVGHLFSFNPTLAKILPEQSQQFHLPRAVYYSVGLIVAMSLLDLAWTLMASSVGLMNELNPVGSRLIGNPDALVAFKAVATLIAAALLISLRDRRSAQMAAWWLCIVCTLVSARWLIFNSMYMG